MKIRRVDFYAVDFIDGVIGFTPEQVGVYWLLCSIFYATGGPVPEEMALSKISAMSKMRVKGVLRIVENLIKVGKILRKDGTLFALRCGKELERANNRVTKSRENANKRWKNNDSPDAPAENDGMLSDNKQQTTSNKQQSPPTEDAEASVKEQVFAIGRKYLQTKAGLSARQAGSLLGKWIRDHGEPNTLEAISAASKNSPPDPVAYITRILKPKVSDAKPNTASGAAANMQRHLAGLARACGLGEMETGEPSADDEGRIIDGDFRAVEETHPGEPEGIRPVNGKPDNIRNGVRHPVPCPGNGAANLPGAAIEVAGGFAKVGGGQDQGGMDVGKQDAVPGGDSSQDQRRINPQNKTSSNSRGGPVENPRGNGRQKHERHPSREVARVEVEDW